MKKLLIMFLLSLGCSKKPEVTVCQECPRCPEPLICRTEEEIAQGLLKDWVKLGDYEYKCMQRNPGLGVLDPTLQQ